MERKRTDLLRSVKNDKGRSLFVYWIAAYKHMD